MTPSGRRRALGIAVATSLIAALVALGWWWTHPRLFRDLGVVVSMDHSVPVAKATFYESVVEPRLKGGETVSVRSAAAHFTTNSAAADVTFVVCRDGVVGLGGPPLSRYCREITALPSTFHYVGGSRDSIVMAVVARHPGQVNIDKVTIDYRRGSDGLWQRGTQTIRAGLSFSAR